MAKRKSINTNRKAISSPAIDLLKTTNQVSTGRSLRATGSGDVTRLAVGSRINAKPIQFGSPSDKGNKASSSKKNGNGWGGLLESFSTGGISDLLGGGGFLSSGLDYLSNELQSIFGGTSDVSTQPLDRFALPDLQDQTISVGNMQSAGQEPGTSNTLLGSYDGAQSTRLSQMSKAEIVQTVKNALLTSSSLNDVIGEL